MKNRQDIFIEVVQHLCAQGRQSSDGINCMYRGPDNTKCPSGWLIPDSFRIDARTNIFGLGASLIQQGLLEGGVDLRKPSIRRLMYELQSIHDLGEVSDWPRAFTNLARSLRLDPTVVHNAYGLG